MVSIPLRPVRPVYFPDEGHSPVLYHYHAFKDLLTHRGLETGTRGELILGERALPLEWLAFLFVLCDLFTFLTKAAVQFFIIITLSRIYLRIVAFSGLNIAI
jgi:hypothetical protein